MLNMKTREDRQKHANDHYEDIKVRLAEETQASINGTTIHTGLKTRAKNEKEIERKLRLVDLDSVSCLFEMPCEGKTCVLNYASFKFPGGYFLGGSSAQEEALCHESNLYPILLSFDKTYYAQNRKNVNLSLYKDRALYSPNIVFEHNGMTKTADVLTCAAPNYASAHKYNNVDLEYNLNVFRQRIKFMLQIAEEKGVDTLILGAWGCGVFKQPPAEVCMMLLQEIAIEKYNIPNIYFAIPNRASENFRAFQSICDNFPGWR